MHRQNPLQQGYVGYTASGARSLVDEIDDKTGMQEMKGSFMGGEAREKIESPQNYGFTSVVNKATKGKDGKITECAEAYINFLGGNRSFPIASVMDDRRYRLKELKPGDVAMFDHLQHQMHFNKDGVFITGRTDKKMKFQLAEPPQDEGGGGGGGSGKSAETLDGSVESLAAGDSSSSSSSSSGGGMKKKGQKQRYEKESKQHVEMTKGKTELVHDQTIEHKTPLHSFQPGSGGTARSGGPLVQIFGDKFTNGLGKFMKQVEAAPPTKPTELTTKGYVDSIFAALGVAIPPLPPLPFPPLPPGVTLPPGILPVVHEEEVSTGYDATAPKLFETMEARIVALERRVAELESRISHA
jgi:phage gp45-like